MNEKKKKREYEALRRRIPDQLPCPICGERQFNWGYAGGMAFMEKRNSWFGEGMTEVVARECMVCGSVQLFTNRGTKFGVPKYK